MSKDGEEGGGFPGIALLVVGLVGGALGIIVGTAIGVERTEDVFHRQAIERGYAEYNKVTGKWRWIEPVTKEKKGEKDN